MNKRFKVRFPNESSFDDVSLDLDFFLRDKEFSNEVFGWYKGTYVSILKESLNDN